MSTLRQGQNTAFSADVDHVAVSVSWDRRSATLDITCFMVDASGKVPSDDYMVFYNQPTAPNGSVNVSNTDPGSVGFGLRLSQIPNNIQRCVFTATIDGAGTFGTVEDVSITAAGLNGDEVTYNVEKSSDERALIIAEIYRHNSGWKMRAVNQGFNGGLAPLARHFGVEVADEEPTTAAATPPPPPPPAPVKKVNLTKIDLLKEKVVVSLAKKSLTGEKARLAVVLDASGSMYHLFATGVVQRAFEKALAVAACMDDNGSIDVWFFGTGVMRGPSVTEDQFEGYVKRVHGAPGAPIGYDNNEPAVMLDVIKKYVEEEPDPTTPVYVLFFSDGGIDKSKEISKLLIDSSNQPIFWQFIGLGNAPYGILRNLDTLPGRMVDNAGFFSLDDLDKVSDEELYDRILSEFPMWLKEARAKGIVGPTGLKCKVNTSGATHVASSAGSGKKSGLFGWFS